MARDYLETLKARAQRIANSTHTPRWVIYTSLGWRIEWHEPANLDDALFYRFDPVEARAGG